MIFLRNFRSKKQACILVAPDREKNSQIQAGYFGEDQ